MVHGTRMCMTYEIQWRKSIFSRSHSESNPVFLISPFFSHTHTPTPTPTHARLSLLVWWQSVCAPHFAIFHFMLWIWMDGWIDGWIHWLCDALSWLCSRRACVCVSMWMCVHTLACLLACVCDINIVPVCVRTYVRVPECDCVCVCARVWISVCVLTLEFAVLVYIHYGTCLASNKNSLWICQSAHYAGECYAVFGIICCHHAYFIFGYVIHFFLLTAVAMIQSMTVPWKSYCLSLACLLFISSLIETDRQTNTHSHSCELSRIQTRPCTLHTNIYAMTMTKSMTLKLISVSRGSQMIWTIFFVAIFTPIFNFNCTTFTSDNDGTGEWWKGSGKRLSIQIKSTIKSH